MRSLRSKILLIFLGFVLAITIVTGTYLLISISNFYDNRFIGDMDRVFTENFIAQAEAELGGSHSVDALEGRIIAYANQLGINSYRSYYILEKNTGQRAQGVKNAMDTDAFVNDTILNAMTGTKSSSISGEYMDYAVPIWNYIVYVRDSKEESRSIMYNLLIIIAQALGLGILISIILAFFISRNITKPISVLIDTANNIKQGKFGGKLEIHSNDEIGQLAVAFSSMGMQLKENINLLENEKTKIETILSSMHDGVIAFDSEGTIIMNNNAAINLLQIEQLHELGFNELFQLVSVDILIGDLLYIDDTKRPTHDFNWNGMVIRGNFASFKLTSDDKRGVVVALSDVTANERMELSRREFVANVSHELRTPLTTIKTYSETVMDEHLDDPMTKKFMTTVIEEVDRMTRLVKDLLLLSSLGSNMTLKHEPIDINLLTKRVAERLGANAKEAGQFLIFQSWNKNEPLMVMGDLDRLEQVVVNIIANAIKYTGKNGTIQVFCGEFHQDAYIKVVDNGIGISDENQRRIFERFYRVDKARTRANSQNGPGGTGLGLSIASEIIALHKGNIQVSSKENKGTEMVITLPKM